MEEQRPAPPKPTRREEITRLVRAYIGPRWDEHYGRAWSKLGSDAGVNIGVSWNWAAALVTVPWLAYRKHSQLGLGVVGAFLLANYFIGGLVNHLTPWPIAPYAIWLVIAAVFGCYGDLVILQRAYAVAADVHNEVGGSKAIASSVIAKGGVSPGQVAGVMALPIVLAAAVYFVFLRPYLEHGRKIEEDALRSYVDEVSTMQEIFHVDSARFVADTAAFKGIADSLKRRPPVIVATDSSYQATVSNQSPLSDDPPLIECAIAVRAPNPLSGDTTNSIICRRYFDRPKADRTPR